MLAIIIPGNGAEPLRIEPVPSAPLYWLQSKLGESVEGVRLSGDRYVWFSKMGKQRHLPLNVAATGLAFLHGMRDDYVPGDAVILGHDGPEGMGLNVEQFGCTLTELTISMIGLKLFG